MTAATYETTLRRHLAAAVEPINPPPVLEEIRSRIAAAHHRPAAYIRDAFFRVAAWAGGVAAAIRVTRTKENAVNTSMSMDPNDPTEMPLALVPTDVVTRHPDKGERGAWTFVKAEDLGLRVLLRCVDENGREVPFTVDRSTAIHIAPRGSIDAFWDTPRGSGFFRFWRAA